MDNKRSHIVSCDLLREFADKAPLEVGEGHLEEKSTSDLIGARIIGHFVDHPEAGDSNHPGH
jgi:hypothetical protein